MEFSILLQENPPIPSHAMLALAALALGGLQLALAKGTALHQYTGYAWVSLMTFVCISSFFIHEIRVWGDFSPIHILSVVTLVSLVVAVHAAIQGNIRLHQRVMQVLYFLALVVTGLFTLLPGRAMNAVVFGS